MMDQITKNIFIGNFSDAKNVVALQKAGVVSVLNVAFDLDYHLPPQFFQCKVGLIDGTGNDFEWFRLAVNTLARLQSLGKTLIHCHEGKSRSAAVLATYLASQNNSLLGEAVVLIQSVRSIINPHPALLALGKQFLENLPNKS